MNERTSLAGQDVVFGCGISSSSFLFPFFTSSTTGIQIFRVKVGSTYTLSDIRGYTISGPSGLSCNSMRATSDTVLCVNAKSSSTKTLLLFKISFNEAVAASVVYERRIYYPALGSSTSLSLKSLIKPLGAG
jgi:hypothetical protein